MRIPTVFKGASALVLLLLVLATVMPSGLVAPGLPTLTVTIEDVDDIETDPVEFTHVTVRGTVTVENFLTGVTVKVNASTDNYWLVTVSPQTITVSQGTGGRTENINMDIRVPPRASAERPVNLILYVNATNALGFEYEDDDNVSLRVEQYFGLRSSTDGTSTLEQGKNSTVRMRITNSGNGLDNLTVALTNKAALEDKGVELDFPAEMHEIGQDRIANIMVTVTAAPDAEVGTVEASFKVASKGDPSHSVNYNITINVQKAKDGNGGNGDEPTDDDDGGFIPAIGSSAAIIALVALGAVLATRRLRR
jgi:hypothetical protein